MQEIKKSDNLVKIGLTVLLSVFIFTACSDTELKFNITTIYKQNIRLTKDNILEIKEHQTQNYFNKYSTNDIQKIGFIKQALPYTNRNIITGNKQDLQANVLVIEFSNSTTSTFYLEQNDDVEEVLKNANFKLVSLDAKPKNMQ